MEATRGQEVDAVFFAAMPPPRIGRAIAGLGPRLWNGGELRVAWRPARVLHVSLAAVGVWGALSPDAVRRAVLAGDDLREKAFPVHFVTAVPFGGVRRQPLVLCCDDSSARSLAGLARCLKSGLDAKGLAKARPVLTPHLTLGYTAGHVDPAPLARPVGWMVRDVVLVHSRYGETRYELLGRWPLAAGLAHRPADARED